MLLSICAMTLLCWKAPHLASSVLAGSPSFGGSGLAAAPSARPAWPRRSRRRARRGHCERRGRRPPRLPPAARVRLGSGGGAAGAAQGAARCAPLRPQPPPRAGGAPSARARRAASAPRRRRPKPTRPSCGAPAARPPPRASAHARHLRPPTPEENLMTAQSSWRPDGSLDTPYRLARQEWDARMGSALVHAKNWRLATFAALGAVRLSIVGLIVPRHASPKPCRTSSRSTTSAPPPTAARRRAAPPSTPRPTRSSSTRCGASSKTRARSRRTCWSLKRNWLDAYTPRHRRTPATR